MDENIATASITKAELEELLRERFPGVPASARLHVYETAEGPYDVLAELRWPAEPQMVRLDTGQAGVKGNAL